MSGPAPGLDRVLVLDTNVVLDLFVFEDPATAGLRASIEGGQQRWIATAAMRTELQRVLGYPRIVRWLHRRGLDAGAAAAAALAHFDAHSERVAVPATAAAVRCSDPDDQPFLDLAVAHPARLLSRDRALQAAWHRMARTAAAPCRTAPETP